MTTVLAGSLFHTQAVEPHDFGLRGHAVGFVDDDDFPAAAALRAEVHAAEQVFDGAAVLRAAGDLDDAAPVPVAAEFVGQRPGGGGFADAAGAGEDEGVGLRGGREGGEAADDGRLAVDVGEAGGAVGGQAWSSAPRHLGPRDRGWRLAFGLGLMRGKARLLQGVAFRTLRSRASLEIRERSGSRGVLAGFVSGRICILPTENIEESPRISKIGIARIGMAGGCQPGEN